MMKRRWNERDESEKERKRRETSMKAHKRMGCDIVPGDFSEDLGHHIILSQE